MQKLTSRTDLRLLSELYAIDSPDSILLTEYPSSNSSETRFQNDREFIIHDPFPPPRRELLKYLGPHHLMCAWGDAIPVTSEIAPQEPLLNHWQQIFGHGGKPDWLSVDRIFEVNTEKQFITLFPHQSVAAEQQVIDPTANYRLHSKEAIALIDCPQADVLPNVTFPCIVKLSHGYAGLGNFLLNNAEDEAAMRVELEKHWPDATIVISSIIPNIVGDYGVQFYLHRDGSMVWLGLTQQHFNEANRWSGGSYSEPLQRELLASMTPFVEATGKLLHESGYFGVVGIDVLKTQTDEFFLVDLNPRLTGITPFLMASRIFANELGHPHGVYRAKCSFSGSLTELIDAAEAVEHCQVLVLSAFEENIDGRDVTLCHLSASGATIAASDQALEDLLT
jgi:hypothetical protein